MLQREEIYQRVWGYAMAHGDRSVDVFVRKLRQKLEARRRAGATSTRTSGSATGSRPEPVVTEARTRRAVSGERGREGRRAADEARRRRGVLHQVSFPPWAPTAARDLRNIAIILALAVVVWQLPGGGTGQPDDQQRAAGSSSSAACCSSATGSTWSTARRSSASRSASGDPLRLPRARRDHAGRHQSHVGRTAASARSCGSRSSALALGRCTPSGAPTASTEPPCRLLQRRPVAPSGSRARRRPRTRALRRCASDLGGEQHLEPARVDVIDPGEVERRQEGSIRRVACSTPSSRAAVLRSSLPVTRSSTSAIEVPLELDCQAFRAHRPGTLLDGYCL